jgi:hypothetical protein
VAEFNEMPATERIHRMANDNINLADDIESKEDCEPVFDIWSDDGARRYNEIIEEGGAYLMSNPHSIKDYEEDIDVEECEYRDPDLYDPDEETLSPGEMEIIMENCYTF